MLKVTKFRGITASSSKKALHTVDFLGLVFHFCLPLTPQDFNDLLGVPVPMTPASLPRICGPLVIKMQFTLKFTLETAEV